MSRSIDATVLAEAGKGAYISVYLVEADFDPWIYLTDAPIPLTWSGNTYLNSEFLGVSGIAETAELVENDASVSLSGVDQQVIGLLLGETYLNRRLRVRQAFLDASLAIIGTPILRLDGRMNAPTVTADPDGGVCSCSVRVTSLWTLSQRNGWHTNPTDVRREFPDDTSFDRVASIPTSFLWGDQAKAIGSPAPRKTKGYL